MTLIRLFAASLFPFLMLPPTGVGGSCAVSTASGGSCTASVAAAGGVDTAFLAIHRAAVVVDGHNDVLTQVMRGARFDATRRDGHSDLARFAAGGVDVQLFSIWVAPQIRTPWAYANAMIDSLDAIVTRNPRRLALVRSGAQLRDAIAAGKTAAILALEGGHPGDDQPRARIAALYARGLRCFGLTWNNSTSWASSARDEASGRRRGLSARGRSTIAQLDSLGVLIDVSHAGPQTVSDVLASTRHPIIASHSACTALCASPRNLTDGQIRAIASKGGIVMINFFPGFLKCPLPPRVRERCNALNLRLAGLRAHHISRESLAERDTIVARAGRAGLPTIRDVVAHIAHAVTVAGADHVGLGSDFDGIDYAPVGLGDDADLPYLTRELLRTGFSTGDVGKILGRNFVRVFEAVCTR